MKKLVAAALTAVAAVVAAPAIALTPVHAQEAPESETNAPSTTTQAPASIGSNIVVFVIPASAGEIADAACSVDEVAQESRSRPMRFGARESRERTFSGPASARPDSRRHDVDEGEEAEDAVGLPSEACTTLRGLFASLAGLVTQAPATDATVADDEEDAGTADADNETTNVPADSEDEEAVPSNEDDDASGEEADDSEGTLTPTGRTSVYVTIFAGGDAGEDGCMLSDLIAEASGAVPVVEAGGEVPLQGAADVSDIALPADACALLTALFGAIAPPATTTPEGTTPPSPPTGDAEQPDAADDVEDADEADTGDDADADDGDDGDATTPEAGSASTGTPSAGGTRAPGSTGTPAPSSTATATPSPTATGTAQADGSDAEDEDETPTGDEP